ncbi:MAG: transporter substrate-binding domain-containing protein [Campylobacterota bacterium]|nr:transporter substrate-binding domain-containing protein [Campylobacterota bacterium]
MRNNVFYIFLYLLVFNTVLVAHSTSVITLTAQEQSYLKSHSVLKAHNEQNWPPFNFNENGIAKGFSIDYMNLLAKKLNIKVKYISGYSWSEYMKMVHTPDLDVIINISKNKQRAKLISFTEQFYTTQNAIYTNKKNHNFRTLEDLKFKTVAISKGFFIQRFLERDHQDIKLVFVKNQLEALKLLSLGKVDATIGKKVVMDYIISHNNISNIVVTNYIEDKKSISNIRLGVSKDDKILRDILQKGQDAVSYKEFRELKEKWFGVKTDIKDSVLNLTDKQKEYLKTKNELTVCVKKGWLPYESFENGKFIGLSADFLNLYAKKLNISLKIINTENQTKSLEYLKARRCDIKPLIEIETKAIIPYKSTETYFSDTISLTTKIEQPYISNIRNIKNQTVIVLKGFNNLTTLIKTEYPNLKLKVVDDINTALALVAKGDAFGYIGTSLSSSYYIQKQFSNRLKILNSFKKFEFGIGVENSEPMLLEILNKTMKQTTQTEKTDIYNRWIVTTVENKPDYTLVWQVVVTSVLILITMIYFLIKEKKLKKRLELKNKDIEKYKNRLELAFSGSNDGLWDWDLINNTIYFSPRFKSMIGYRDDEIENSIDTWESLVHPDDLEQANRDIQSHLDGETEMYENTHRLKHKDGSWIWILDRGKAQFDKDGKATRFIGTHTDFTREKELTDNLAHLVSQNIKELREKDNTLLQQSKLAAVGEMVGNIAHQWRQPLNIIGAINMKVETMLDFGESITAKNYLAVSDDINKQLQFMSKTIDDFRDFFNDSKEKSDFDIFETINEVYSLINIQYTNKNIHLEIKGDNIVYYGLKNELKQVLINILNNAKDAIVSQQDKNIIKDGYIQIILKRTEKYIIIEIKDNGGGIPENIMDKIFEPYFTTKFKSKGTGIGLYMSYQIIHEHMDGLIDIKNVKYKHNGKQFAGALFTITLPIDINLKIDKE